MNFANLLFWSTSIIAGLVGTYNIDAIQKTVQKAQAKLICEGFVNFFGAVNEFVALDALAQLTQAGLSEAQILAGMEAGCKVMAKEN